MDSNYYCYIHLKKSDQTVFYVWQGRGNRAWSKAGRNNYWNRTAKKYGFEVTLVHENLTKEQAAVHEIQLIAQYRAISGKELTNMTSGGDGGMAGFSHSDESKKKIGEASKGNKYAVGNTSRRGSTHTEETKAIIKAKRALQVPSWKGVPMTEATKEKLRQAKLGTKMSAESSLKKSLSQTGKPRALAAIAKTAAANTGKTRTEEQRLKMAMAQQKNKFWAGKQIPEETKEKMRLAQQNMTDEAKAARSEKLRLASVGRQINPDSGKKQSATKARLKAECEALKIANLIN